MWEGFFDVALNGSLSVVAFGEVTLSQVSVVEYRPAKVRTRMPSLAQYRFFVILKRPIQYFSSLAL